MHKIALMTAMLAFAATSALGAELELKGCPRSTDYGSGIFYLGCSDIGKALVELRQRYPTAVISFASYSGVMHGGGTGGYYVIINLGPGMLD